MANHRKQLIGTIVSDKMPKTRVVEVERIKEHSRYKKQFKISKKYKAHDEKNEYKVGDRVIIEETRPLSKEKRWKIKGFVSH
jgi:small subunit ribosomal protein S17